MGILFIHSAVAAGSQGFSLSDESLEVLNLRTVYLAWFFGVQELSY